MPPAEMRHERVVVETDRYRVEGDITLPQGIAAAFPII